LADVLHAWAVQRRVIGAIWMREIQTRWGRRNLGFAWLFAEPLVFSFPVLTMWALMRGRFENGLALIPLLWTGYLPLLMFRHTTGLAMKCVWANAALLYHRRVTPFDLIIGRCGLELIGNMGALAFSFVVFYLLGFMPLPANYSLFLLGILFNAWWSMAVAMLVAAWSERSDLVEHIWPPISYIWLPISGCFYLAEWLPSSVRAVALTLVPSLQCYEIIRGGLFGGRIQVFYNIPYLTSLLAVLTFLGLWVMKDLRHYIELE